MPLPILELLETVETDEIACEREIYYIKHFNTYGSNGYNATFGGDGKSYINKEKVKDTLLKFLDKTSQEIADICDCCSDVVRQIAKENNIHIKTSQEKV